MGKLVRLMIAIAVAAASVSGAVAYAQSRGGMPGGMPGGIPGPPGGPGSIGGPSTPFPHEPPIWAGGPPDQAHNGLATAAAAQNYRLSKPQLDRATEMANGAPDQYEVDRNGALAIRGEVLVSEYDAAQLAKLERAGFTVLRRSEVGDLGIEFAVVIHDGMTAARALKRLRQLDPDGSFDLNHVFFESGRDGERAPQAIEGSVSDQGQPEVVGLIDTGVARTAEASPRIRVIRRNFAPTESSGAPHGTAVASLMARAPGRVTIYAADIFGSGPRGGTAELMIQAMGWMAGQRVPVINISMVGPPNSLVANATRVMIARGFIIVAPVGNDGAAAKLLFPASYPGVIAVSGSDGAGRLLPEASRVKRVDFVAPGIATVVDPQGHDSIVRGTSFAAPLVSRRLAGYARAPDPATAREAIRRLAQNAVRPKAGREWFGFGLIAAQ